MLSFAALSRCQDGLTGSPNWAAAALTAPRPQPRAAGSGAGSRGGWEEEEEEDGAGSAPPRDQGKVWIAHHPKSDKDRQLSKDAGNASSQPHTLQSTEPFPGRTVPPAASMRYSNSFQCSRFSGKGRGFYRSKMWTRRIGNRFCQGYGFTLNECCVIHQDAFCPCSRAIAGI